MGKGEKLTFGFLTDRMYFSLPVEMYSGIRKAAAENDIGIISFSGMPLNSTRDYCRQANILYELANRDNVDGIIMASNVISYDIGQDELIRFAGNYGDIPLISLGITIENACSIIPDNKPGMTEVIDHLITVHGRKKIAFICGPENNDDAKERLDAYREVLAKHNLPLNPDLILPANFTPESGKQATIALLDGRKMKPGKDFDALVAANDYMAREAYLLLQHRNVDIPHDVALAGFDDIFPIRCLIPSMTSVYTPFFESGELAVQLLLDKISGRKVDDLYRMTAVPHFRQSCGCQQGVVNKSENTAIIPEPILSAIKKNPSVYLHQMNEDIVSKSIPSFDLMAWEDLIAGLRFNIPGTVKTEESPMLANREMWEGLARSFYLSIDKKMQSLNYESTSNELGRAIYLSEICEILGRRLPVHGINYCFLVLYETPPPFVFPQKAPEKSRLHFAMIDGQPEKLPEAGLLFNTASIVPEKYKSCIREGLTIMEALYFRETQFGYILMEAGSPDEARYTHLQIQLSSSLQGVLLVRQVQENAGELKKANQKIKVLNARLNEENLEMHAEMKVAERIQTALLPGNLENINRDFDIFGKMVPADEVGGDYFDIIKTSDDTFWAGIGDVSGHGVTPGLIMMMSQTMHSLIIRNYRITPKEVLVMMNEILLENIGNRLRESNYMSFTSLRYNGEGRFMYAGLHQDIIIYRKKKKKCEMIPTTGTWLNLVEDINSITENGELRLGSGDLLVLYTDGFTELFDKNRKMLGIDRLAALVEKHAAGTAEEAVDDIFKESMEWSDGRNRDDMTLVVLKMK